ncbi:MAG: type IV pilus assembly protein PilM [Candidatus Omnitrophota bacterium]|nr:pilus assembly protein PilM [Candidatus Omnitrophota bacterium]
MAKNKRITNETVGLDIGSYSLKVVSLEKRAETQTLRAYNIKSVPWNIKETELKKAIKELLKGAELSPSEVNLSLSGPDVIVRFVNLPKMKKDQLESALVYEAEKYIPFSVNEVVLDSIIIGEIQEHGQMKVLLAAAKRELVDARIRLLSELGIGINILDIAPFAVYNAFIRSHELPAEEVSAFLNIGHSQTDVLVFSDGMPCFMRQIQIGGKNITDLISRELSVSEDEAEKAKSVPDESLGDDVRAIQIQVIKEIVNELHLSFGYFENRYNKRVSKIYCSGGAVSQKDKIALIGKELGMDIKGWDPIGRIKLDETIPEEEILSVSPQLAVAIGLALRT